jgi:hypothetical protein
LNFLFYLFVANLFELIFLFFFPSILSIYYTVLIYVNLIIL